MIHPKWWVWPFVLDRKAPFFIRRRTAGERLAALAGVARQDTEKRRLLAALLIAREQKGAMLRESVAYAQAAKLRAQTDVLSGE